MPEYRRPWVPGATYFLTLVMYHRQPIFKDDAAVDLWRQALITASLRHPFTVLAGVVLPDHLHVIIELPKDEADISKRVGIAKAQFTKSLPIDPRTPASRTRRRERAVWQRRFFDHLIRDGDDFIAHMDYLHYNPVKHGHATRPVDWPWSSFRHWVENGAYSIDWCAGKRDDVPDFSAIEKTVGE